MPSSDPPSAQRRLFKHELAEKLDALLSASASHRSVERLATLLEPLSRLQQERVLHWTAVAAQTYVEIAYLIASLAPQALGRFGTEAFDDWVIAGLDVCDKEGLRPAVAMLRDLDAWTAEKEGRRGACLSEVEQRLTRLLHGLSGRCLTLRMDAQPWTDTETIFLPDRIAHFPAAEENRRLYLALAVLLWAQTRYGTFDIDLEGELARQPDRQRALVWLAHLEALRLETCVVRDLPGLGRMLGEVRAPWPAELLEAGSELGVPGADVRTSLKWLERLMAQDAVPPEPTFCGRLDPAAAALARAERIARDTATLRKALAALKGVAGKRPAAPGEFSARMDAATGAMEVHAAGEAVKLPEDALKAMQSLLQDLGEVPPAALTPAGEGGWLPADRVAAADEAVEVAGPDHHRYDEWDCHRSAYRRDWCHVFETEVQPGDGHFVREVRQRHAPFIRQLRRRFEALRGTDRMLARQDEGEEIDLDALIEALQDRRGGIPPTQRLFCRRARVERSLATIFLVDMSGSTQGWVNAAEREALVMLCEALEELGDDYAIFGFSGWTRTRCDIYRIKDFADRYDEAVHARIDAIDARDYTRMGAAIRHLTRRLVRQAARHKLLVMLSDGRPDDFGDEYRGRYGIEDTRRALQEARLQGIHSYCITIDRQGADYLRRMVGPAGFTVLDDAKKLPFKIADIYRRLTA